MLLRISCSASTGSLRCDFLWTYTHPISHDQERILDWFFLSSNIYLFVAWGTLALVQCMCVQLFAWDTWIPACRSSLFVFVHKGRTDTLGKASLASRMSRIKFMYHGSDGMAWWMVNCFYTVSCNDRCQWIILLWMSNTGEQTRRLNHMMM